MASSTFWDERYSADEFIFGRDPNVFFRKQLNKLTPCNLLLPAEGEGRNAVYAAREGWQVAAFDISLQGREKALRLAASFGVDIDYQVADFFTVTYPPESFDVVALVFFHINDEMQRDAHRRLAGWLRPGGTLILEAYHKEHLGYRDRYGSVGGPADADRMYELKSLVNDFGKFDFSYAAEEDDTLHEGQHHTGMSRLVRLVGIKL
jgi:hypothetical protein